MPFSELPCPPSLIALRVLQGYAVQPYRPVGTYIYYNFPQLHQYLGRLYYYYSTEFENVFICAGSAWGGLGPAGGCHVPPAPCPVPPDPCPSAPLLRYPSQGLCSLPRAPLPLCFAAPLRASAPCPSARCPSARCPLSLWVSAPCLSAPCPCAPSRCPCLSARCPPPIFVLKSITEIVRGPVGLHLWQS